jgi:hypothetical protein
MEARQRAPPELGEESGEIAQLIAVGRSTDSTPSCIHTAKTHPIEESVRLYLDVCSAGVHRDLEKEFKRGVKGGK